MLRPIFHDPKYSRPLSPWVSFAVTIAIVAFMLLSSN